LGLKIALSVALNSDNKWQAEQLNHKAAQVKEQQKASVCVVASL
jgi:hypothetical protein